MDHIEENHKSNKKRWIWFIGGFIVFVILKSCVASVFSDDTYDSLLDNSMLAKVAVSGYQSEWSQLTLNDKLKIADAAIKIYEDKHDVDLNIDAVGLVDQMDQMYGTVFDDSNVTIAQELEFLLNIERGMEHK